MLISIEELKRIYTDKDFSKLNDERLKRKLEAIEVAIRKYTHNNFHSPFKRSYMPAIDNKLYGAIKYFKVGDTVEVTHSKINDGLYIVKSVGVDYITLDKEVYDCPSLLVTKVEYPSDVIDGAIELLDWEINVRDKKGITSESISRHSVSYKQYDAHNTVEGYPSEMFGFVQKYTKWIT